jgi:hypothetical protein
MIQVKQIRASFRMLTIDSVEENEHLINGRVVTWSCKQTAREIEKKPI